MRMEQQVALRNMKYYKRRNREKTSKYFKDYNAVLMANHGFIVGDKTLKEAYLKLELAESYAQVVLQSKILGGAVLLNEEQVKEIYELR